MKKIYKSFLALLLGTTLTIGCLTGCGSKDASNGDAAKESEVKDKGLDAESKKAETRSI